METERQRDRDKERNREIDTDIKNAFVIKIQHVQAEHVEQAYPLYKFKAL